MVCVELHRFPIVIIWSRGGPVASAASLHNYQKTRDNRTIRADFTPNAPKGHPPPGKSSLTQAGEARSTRFVTSRLPQSGFNSITIRRSLGLTQATSLALAPGLAVWAVWAGWAVRAVWDDSPMTTRRVVIIGGGPGGYEAALVGRRLGAQVVLVDKAGLGGAAVLTDVVPSKSLIATAEWMTIVARAPDLGIRLPDELRETRSLVDMSAVNARLQEMATAQSRDIERRVLKAGVEVVAGTGRLVGSTGQPVGSRQVAVQPNDGGEERLIDADVVLIATGATPRVLPTAVPDGERILSWTQLYGLTEMPGRLIVVGSGVTGAEFAGAYSALGVDVVLVSSRDQVLPNQDPDAAALIERVFTERGMTVLGNSRAVAARRTADGVVVELDGGRTVEGTHALIAVGSVPTTQGLGLAEAGVRLTGSGHIEVDRVSRTSVAGVYAAGDCTGVLPLASVSAQQGRIAMSHALGDAVRPLSLAAVATNVFTAPEIAAVGRSEAELKARGRSYSVSRLPLARNPRAKMLGIHDGFVKIFTHTTSGTVLGSVIVAPRAGEFIYPLSLAVAHGLTVDHLANASTVYPSLSGTIAEVARMLHHADSDG